MSLPDVEDEFGCYHVYLCKKCDEAKPRVDFFKMYDYKTMSEIKYKTCKDFRNKVTETKRTYKTKPRNQHERLNS